MSTRSKAAHDSEEKTPTKKKRGRPAKAKAVVEPSVTEKTEDSDTDVDESVAQTKPQDESQSAVVTGDKENGETKMNDSQVDSDKAEVVEDKAADKEKSEASVDAENAEEKKDVLVVEDEEEEPETEDEVVEDRDDGGEDPSEVEVEKFNMPVEQVLLNDLTDMRCRRRLIVYPLKMSELSHPTLMEAVGLSTEFRTSYMKSRVGGSVDTMTWVGYVELNLKSTIIASDCMQSLKTIREDLTVRIMEPGENPQRLIQSSGHDFPDPDSKLFASIILARPLPDDTTVATMKDLFPGATEIAFPRQVLGTKMAYVVYEDKSAMCAAFDKLIAEPPSVAGRQLRLMKYDPSVEWPAGLLRLKRRYRVLLQMNRLRKAIKDPQNGRYMDTMKSTVSHCKSLIEKDDATRKELGLEVLSFAELRQYKRIRDSVDEDAIWLPGKRMTGGFDRRSFVDEDEDDERYRKSWRGRGTSDTAGIPSLMSVGLDPSFNPVARAQAIAHQIARMAVAGGPAAAPKPPLLRGGPPFVGPRGMMRGPRPMRGGPMGGFPGSRGGFFGDGPPHDEMMGWRGGRGGGFGRGGFGRGRGDFHGDDGGFGGRGGRFGEGFNKRPRSPPRGGGGYRGGRDSSGEAPFKMSRGERDSSRGRSDHRGRGASAGPSAGFHQSRGGGGGGGAGGSGGGGAGGAGTGTSSGTTGASGGGAGGSRWSKPHTDWNKSTSDQGGFKAGKSAGGSVGGAAATSSAAGGGYNAPSSGYNAPAASSGYGVLSSAGTQGSTASSAGRFSAAGGYSAAGSQSNYGQANYGQQQQPQQQQQQQYQQQQMSYNTAAAGTTPGYGQTSYTQPTTAYPQQQQQQQQQQATTGYPQNYMQGTGYSGTGSVQTGYGQTDASAAYSQTQNMYAGYTQQTGTDYYQQAAAAGYQANTGQQMTGAQQTAAQGWPMMPQQTGQQQQQQYWPTAQQAASWPGTDPNAQAQVTDPNAAAAAYAAAYNWPGWK